MEQENIPCTVNYSSFETVPRFRLNENLMFLQNTQGIGRKIKEKKIQPAQSTKFNVYMFLGWPFDIT